MRGAFNPTHRGPLTIITQPDGMKLWENRAYTDSASLEAKKPRMMWKATVNNMDTDTA